MFHYLEEELDSLRTRIIKMGTLVDEQIELAFKGLFEGNIEIAKIVIDRDKKVDKQDVKIDKHCMRIFALAQPVAIDLRLIMSALKINNDLERMGDIAVNIAERVEPLKDFSSLLKEVGIEDMALKTVQVVKRSIDSFVNNDPELARDICRMDDEIDDLNDSIFNTLINKMTTDKNLIPPCSHAIILLKNIERLADHCTNIAEDVIFLVDARIIKHGRTLKKDDEANEKENHIET
jgi:phosphate transport system protein